MLNASEKAYCLALQALKDKDYRKAAEYFDRAAPFFAENREFNLYRETTRLLLAVKRELGAEPESDDELVIEEVFSNGQETDIR